MDELAGGHNKRVRDHSSSSPSPTNTQKNPRVVSPVSKQSSSVSESDLFDSSGLSSVSLIQDISSPDLNNIDSINSMANSSQASTHNVSKEADQHRDNQETGLEDVMYDNPPVFDKNHYMNQRDNRYSESSPSPYIVFVLDTREGFNLGNLHVSNVARYLRDAGIVTISVTSAGTEKAAIVFESVKGANDFVESGISSFPDHWRAIIPDSGIYKVGVIQRLAEDFTEQEFWEGLDDCSKKTIDKIEFMRRKTVKKVDGKDITSFDFIGLSKFIPRKNCRPIFS